MASISKFKDRRQTHKKMSHVAKSGFEMVSINVGLMIIIIFASTSKGPPTADSVSVTGVKG